jgi:dihydroorotate dehydrogenase (NAD+) catalytic subunit
MINAVGLAGPGVPEWLTHGYQSLLAENANVVASIWGRTVEEFALAAEALKGIPVAAVEINASCPNLEARNAIFANSPDATAEVVAATASLTVPRWVKLTTTAPGLLEVVAAAVGAGASAVTLGNTLTGLVIDVESRRPVLGNGGGGVSGEAARPVALRAVFDVRAQYSSLPIIGVGGVSTSKDALAMFMPSRSAKVAVPTLGLRGRSLAGVGAGWIDTASTLCRP